MRVLQGAGAFTVPGGKLSNYEEHLRVPDLSVGTYSIPAGGEDGQQPHTEDEIYVVVRGRGRLEAESGNTDVEPGSVVFVPAGEPHRFTGVTEDLAVLVVFGPAEYTRGRT
jgi:mannose-6-phosphate isomerase-like protein (cupin superfamily)